MRHRIHLAAPLVTLCLLASASAVSAEIQIPAARGDKGQYYLLEAKTKGGITTTVHKRVGVHETGFSRTQINCKTMQYKDVGYGEGGPDKIKALPGGRWADLVQGSSKSELVDFVCRMKS